MYGGNGHFQYSKGNNSKSRKTRVTVHVFSVSSHSVNICVKLHENMSSCFKVIRVCSIYGADTKIVNTQRAITPKVRKPELRFICSALPLMVFNICVKFYENMSSGFKVMEQTQKLLTHKGQ